MNSTSMTNLPCIWCRCLQSSHTKQASCSYCCNIGWPLTS